jgi:dihydroflavonol-4-reductase
MQVAVTGASGFVGINLVRQLLSLGHQVRAIDRTRSNMLVGSQLTWAEADVLDPGAMRKALKDVEVVYHLVAKITLAAEDPVAWRINTEGVRTVAEAAKAAGVRRMVHCSSIHAFDQYRCGGRINLQTPRSTHPGIPVYDRSKYAGELELRKAIDAGLDAVICNPTGIYGPVDYSGSRINHMLLQAARGRIPVLPTGGFDFVDVRDAAAGLVAAAERGRTGSNYILGGHFLKTIEITRLAANAVGRRGPNLTLPLWTLKAVQPIAERIGRLRGSDALTKASIAAIEASPIVDYEHSRNEIGYAPRPAVETIRDLMDFYVRRGHLTPAAGASSASTYP